MLSSKQGLVRYRGFRGCVVAASLVVATVGCSSDGSEADQTGAEVAGDGGSGGPEASADAGGSGGVADLPDLPSDVALPIVFIHGFVGSAQQYESQAIRFAANGYPRERIRAVDHHGVTPDVEALMTEVDELIDELRAEHDTDQVFLVGHSRGTGMSDTYMSVPERADKIAKYISLDGSGCAAADAAGVDCLDPNQEVLPGQAHVEVATSAESFEMQYEFLVDEPPEIVEIVRQPGMVEISGRAVDFPSNAGRDGTTLEIWEIDSDTGYRATDEPLDSFDLGPDGAWGPVMVNPDKHYELTLHNPGGSVQHFYPQRFLRDSHLVRLLSGDPETSATRQNTNSSDQHAAFVAIRMREWYAMDDPDNPGDESDVLEITTDSESGNEDTVNAIQSFVGNGAIALHIHDDTATPEETTLDPLEYFDGQPFQSGVDVFMPANDAPDGTITVRNLPRGDADNPQVLNFPNWSSTDHFISLMFADYAQ